MTTEAEPFAAPDPSELASLFPGYAVESLIACGGMGAVYHARQIALDREVAIKILPQEFSSDEAFRDGFAAEAKAMARLNHPNLIGVYDFGEKAGMLYIIMEFVAGQSLYHAAYQTAVEPREAARLMTEICSGIAEAHRAGILHRDLKPANVLLDLHARPKVGDFGLARPIGTAAKEGEVIYGTPGYTAPEVINQPSQVDARADVFSLGVMLHELLTGKLPSADPRPPSAICGCNVKFDAIVKRATQAVPALRYPDAAMMAKELSDLAAVPAPSMPARTPGMARPPSVRRPRATRVVVKESGGIPWGWLCLLVLLGGAGYWYYKNRVIVVNPTPPPQEAPAPRDTVQLPPPVRQTEEEAARPVLPGPADAPREEGSRIFDTPTRPLGNPAPPRPAYQGPQPVMDMGTYFGRVRRIMQTRVGPAYQSRSNAFAANLSEFERAATRKARAEGGPGAVDAVGKAVAAARANGYRIPDVFKIEGVDDMVYAEAYAAAMKGQEKAQEDFVAALKPQAETYIRGLTLEIDRLKDKNDPGAVNVLNEEIQKVKDDPEYFPTMFGK